MEMLLSDFVEWLDDQKLRKIKVDVGFRRIMVIKIAIEASKEMERWIKIRLVASFFGIGEIT